MKSFKMTKLFLTSFLTLASLSVSADEVIAGAAADAAKAKAKRVAQMTDSKVRECAEPKSPIYKKQSLFEKIDVALITDYATLNQRYSNEQVKGVVRVFRKDKNIFETQPVILAQRGNSRRQMCSNPPFRMQFLKPEIKAKIEAELAEEKLVNSDNEYLKKYLEKLNATAVEISTDIVSLKDGVFKQLGDDVKVVTHCGESQWEMVGGADEQKQYKRLLSEFTVYKVLETLKFPIEHTRLMNMTYLLADGTPAFKDADGNAVSKLAFFREPPKSVAERCGLLSKLDPAAVYPNKGAVDADSEFQTHFVNRFVFNNDYALYGHNMNQFYDIEGKTVYGAYDFDLSGIVVDKYFKNAGSLEDQLPNIMSHLGSVSKEMSHSLVKRVIEQEAAMKQVVADSEIDDEMKARFTKWLDLYIPALKEYIK